MRFGVLGPVSVADHGGLASLGGRSPRVVLAMLLSRANQVVATDTLAEALWGDAPPRTHGKNLQHYVHKLRGSLGGDRIVFQRHGYLIRVDETELDGLVFEELVRLARQSLALGQVCSARERITEALRLWRGPAFADVADVGLLQAQIARLSDLRLSAWEDSLELGLAAGEHQQVVADSTALVAENPVRERLRGLHLIALYRCGRAAEALLSYHDGRRMLVDELGVEPTPALRQIHLAITQGRDPGPAPRRLEEARLAAQEGLIDLQLRLGGQDAAIGEPRRPHQAIERDEPSSPAPARPDAAATRAGMPAQLPPDLRGFVGRAAELARLDAALAEGARQPTAVSIVAVTGMAGVGKTCLAVHWAHRVAGRFPDGQLYVNLHGFDPGGQVVAPAKALSAFLSALDVPLARIPADLAARVALYRSRLSGRRMLILLDNARDAEQVRPLLPGSPTCAVVVTSRSRMAGLVAVDGGVPLCLDPLSTVEARELLTQRIGHARTDATPRAVDGIVALCARLPLALAIVAARAATYTSLTLDELASELLTQRGGLGAYHGGEPASDLRAVFSSSYQALSIPAARMFRLLGLATGPDIGTPAAASLAACSTLDAGRLLAELAEANLVIEQAHGRYGRHDLLRAYAADLTHTGNGDTERRGAVRRLVGHYLHSANAANAWLYPSRERITLDPPSPDVAPEEFADLDDAFAWFACEHPNLLAALDLAERHGLDRAVGQLAWTLTTFLDHGGHWRDWADTQQAALRAAQRLADGDGQARAHRGLARAHAFLGGFDNAHSHLDHALDLCAGLADDSGQARTHMLRSWVLERQERHEEAISHAQRALDLFRRADNLAGQADALNVVGWKHALLGQHRRALGYCRQALALHEGIDYPFGQANAWESLGFAHHRLGHHRQAIRSYRRALDLFQRIHNRYHEAVTLDRIGDLERDTANPQAARSAWKSALLILDDLRHDDAEQIRSKLDST